jgi:putative transposase
VVDGFASTTGCRWRPERGMSQRQHRVLEVATTCAVGHNEAMKPIRHMKRFEVANVTRFLTFSCNQRLPLLGNPLIRDRFARELELTRREMGFTLYAWVLMPEHVHLLLCPRLPEFPVSAVLSRLKRPFAKAVVGRWRELNAPVLAKIRDREGLAHFWLKGGGYDRNIRDEEEFWEKLGYIHRNPVKRGLVKEPRDWAWSSARWYGGEREGTLVEVHVPGWNGNVPLE